MKREKIKAPPLKEGTTFYVPCDRLKTTFDVRKQLNHDHVIALALLYEAGQTLEPISVAEIADEVGFYEIVDGRHRKEARGVAGKSDAFCKLVAGDRLELMAEGFRANYGGALPPNQGDMEYVIEQLVQEGLKEAKIAELLTPCPREVIRKLIINVYARLRRRRVQQALDSVVNSGLSITNAASKFEVDEDDLKELITGKRSKIEQGRGGLDVYKGQLTNRYRGLSQRNARFLGRLLDSYREGVVPERVAFGTLAHMFSSISLHRNNAQSWADRFEIERVNKTKKTKLPAEVLVR